MNAVLLRELEELRRAPLQRLRSQYREVFAEQPRSKHKQQLFRCLAWRMQALAEGELSDRAPSGAREIAQDTDLRTLAMKWSAFRFNPTRAAIPVPVVGSSFGTCKTQVLVPRPPDQMLRPVLRRQFSLFWSSVFRVNPSDLTACVRRPSRLRRGGPGD